MNGGCLTFSVLLDEPFDRLRANGLNRRFLKLVLLFGVLLISGCSSLFEKQPEGAWAIHKHEYRQCLSDLKSDSELDAIADKVTLDTVYDRDEYFDLLSIKDTPTGKEKVAIKKWASKLEHCYKIKARAYAYEPHDVALLSAALDSDQLVLILEFQKGKISYSQFASKRLELDTIYRGKILQAVSAGYKKPDFTQQPNEVLPPKKPLTTF
jgi:hypothetical protein